VTTVVVTANSPTITANRPRLEDPRLEDPRLEDPRLEDPRLERRGG
jgi:hypothetical protein